MSVRRTATASECEKQRNKARPRSHNNSSPVLDDDEYSPSTPTRGNHSIYPTLALQGKAVSPTSPTHLVRDPFFVALRIPYIPKLSLQYRPTGKK